MANGKSTSPLRPWRRALAWMALVLAGGMLAAPAEARTPWDNLREKLASRAKPSDLEMPPPGSPMDPGQAPSVPVPGAPLADSTSGTLPAGGKEGGIMGSAARALSMLGISSESLQHAPGAGLAQRLVQGVDLGRESDEDEAVLASDLFKKPDVRRLLGDKPRFIYNPQKRPDPMVAPWVRRAAIFKELCALAEASEAQGNYDKAVEAYQRILKLRDPQYNAFVHDKLVAIAQLQNVKAQEAMVAAQMMEERVDLPAWVMDNTTGVLISPGQEMCLVGEFMLRVGDVVPNYPEVKVAEITQKKVAYQVRDKVFEVTLPAE